MFLMSVGAIVGIVIAAVIVLVIVILVAWVISMYNRLVTNRNKVRNQFSQIDVQLKRRFDLIPNLVETVKGYANQEKEILNNFAEARKMYDNSRKVDDIAGLAKADARLTSGFNALVNAVQERYPELKSNENFKQLMNELTETENKISYQRQFYNDVVLSYNNSREVFPNVIIANMFGFKAEPFFEADEESRQNVQVKF